MNARYAIYYAPPADSLLWRLGSAWLGRDAITGSTLSPPVVPEMDAARLHALTKSPRHYGLHATLKPPFRLAAGAESGQLTDAIGTLARSLQPFEMPPLQVAVLSGFIAVRPAADCPALQALSDRCVVDLDRFRRPPDEAELAKRRAHGMSPAQEQLLARYGYPYVLGEWRFHITLTERVHGEERDRLCAFLADHLAPALAAPLICNDVCLFVQEDAGAPFVLTQRFATGR
jgi:putative phosphonate metabolism protein